MRKVGGIIGKKKGIICQALVVAMAASSRLVPNLNIIILLIHRTIIYLIGHVHIFLGKLEDD